MDTMTEQMETEVLVIGGGCAGLRAAIAASEEGAQVCLISKSNIGDGSATAFLDQLVEFTALGVTAGEEDKQDYQSDLYDYGHYVNDPQLIELYVKGSSEQLNFLKKLGLEVTGKPQMLPSHRKDRVLRGKGEFGTDMLYKLRDEALKQGVQIIEFASVYKIEKDNFPFNCKVTKRKTNQKDVYEYEDITINFSSLVMASGGGGQIFSLSTNPLGATGDGTGFALQLGAELSNLEFMHYLPLLVYPINGYYIISSITTQGTFYNTKNEKFVPELPENLQNETLAVQQGYLLLEVCQWIEKQVIEGNVTERNGVYWDGRNLIELIKEKIPNSYGKLLKQGLDLGKDIVEIGIGCHQMMGGIRIDTTGTSTVPGLYAAGEAASGFQGAERLMGTGVMDGLVFGEIAGKHAAQFSLSNKKVRHRNTNDINEESVSNHTELITRDSISYLKKQLKKAMDKVLITKDDQRLKTALVEVMRVHDLISDYDIMAQPLHVRSSLSELKNMVLTAKAVVEISQVRKETRGSFKRHDYPEKDLEWTRPISYVLEDKSTLGKAEK